MCKQLDLFLYLSVSICLSLSTTCATVVVCRLSERVQLNSRRSVKSLRDLGQLYSES